MEYNSETNECLPGEVSCNTEEATVQDGECVCNDSQTYWSEDDFMCLESMADECLEDTWFYDETCTDENSSEDCMWYQCTDNC